MTTDHIDPDRHDRDRSDRPDESDSSERSESLAASAGSDRPFGFWLKVVDRRISQEMEALFAADGLTRRDWRLLNLIAGEANDERLAERLRAKPHVLHRLAERLVERRPILGRQGRLAHDPPLRRVLGQGRGRGDQRRRDGQKEGERPHAASVCCFSQASAHSRHRSRMRPM